ncbi:NYN domain-containing protein [Sphingomonas abaci]|uniref:NYN domain-containing protein n=1 Tax=Sphingomonas abaci TaxID=237611 RepID=A0A7W7AME5_9SPHN|nr:hypothetical protein [Sphingomonas abaci]
MRWIYGDCTGTRLNGQAKIAPLDERRPHRNFANSVGKNPSDITPIIDAMNLLCPKRLGGFYLMPSDSHFIQLAARIREQRTDVSSLSENKTPVSFRHVCKRFIYTGHLTSSGKAAPVVTARQTRLMPRRQ